MGNRKSVPSGRNEDSAPAASVYSRSRFVALVLASRSCVHVPRLPRPLLELVNAAYLRRWVDCSKSPRAGNPAGWARCFEAVPKKELPRDHVTCNRKIVFAGSVGCGTSSLILVATSGRRAFSPTYNPTIGADFRAAHYALHDGSPTEKSFIPDSLECQTRGCACRVVTLQCWESSGDPRFRSVTISYLRMAHAIGIGYDITSRASFQEAGVYVRMVDAQVPITLIGYKADREENRQVLATEGHQLAAEISASRPSAPETHFYETSAMTGEGVSGVMYSLAQSSLLGMPEKREMVCRMLGSVNGRSDLARVSVLGWDSAGRLNKRSLK